MAKKPPKLDGSAIDALPSFDGTGIFEMARSLNLALSRASQEWVTICAVTIFIIAVCSRLYFVSSLSMTPVILMMIAPALAGTISIKGYAASLSAVCLTGFVLISFKLNQAASSLELALVAALVTLTFAYLRQTQARRIYFLRRRILDAQAKEKETLKKLNDAGVCLIETSKEMNWIYANKASMTALGCDVTIDFEATNTSVVMDSEILTLMHSGSKWSWTNFIEELRQEAGALSGNEARRFKKTVNLVLYDRDGVHGVYLFTVKNLLDSGYHFVGIQIPDGMIGDPFFDGSFEHMLTQPVSLS